MDNDNAATSGDQASEPVDVTENLNDLPVQEAVEPEAEAVEAAADESEGASDDASSSEDDTSQDDENSDGEASEDIAKSKRRKPTRAERELKRVQRENDELRRNAAPVQPQQAQAPQNLPPQPSDFPGDERGYTDALDQYRIDAGVETALERRAEAERVQQSRREHEAQVSTFKKSGEKLAEKYPDFDEVMRDADDTVPISKVAARAIINAGEAGAEIGYHLSKNPELAQTIHAMDPVRQVLEIGALKNKLAAPPPKKVTQAKDPVKPLGGSGAPTGKKPLSDQSMEEYAASRQPKLLASRR